MRRLLLLLVAGVGVAGCPPPPAPPPPVRPAPPPASQCPRADHGGAATTTTGGDAVPALDHLDPVLPAPLAEAGRLADGSFALPLGGVFEYAARSYCLDAFASSPGNGEAYAWSPLTGWAAPLEQAVLRGVSTHLDADPDDTQALLWAIGGCSPLDSLSDSAQALARTLLTPSQLAQMADDARSCPADGQAAQGSPDAHAALTRALRSGSYEDAERAAVRPPAPRATAAPEDEPQGRWVWLPDGVFARYFPNGYRETRTQILAPEAVDLTRDAKGRLVRVAVPGGERVEVTYDDAAAPGAVPGDGCVAAWRFALVRITARDPNDARHTVQHEVRGAGYALVGIPDPQAQPKDGDPRYPELLTREAAAQRTLAQAPPGDAHAADLVDLASLDVGVRAAMDTDEARRSASAIVLRSWASAYARARGAKVGSARYDAAAGVASPARGSKSQRLGQGGGCAPGTSGQEMLDKARAAQKVLSDASGLVGWSSPEGRAGGAVEWWTGKVPSQPPLPSGPSALFNALMDLVFGTASQMHGALSKDPPRDDYTLIAIPAPWSPPPISPGECASAARAGTLDAIAKGSTTLLATLQAAVITLDRLGGAQRAGDAAASMRQAAALDELKREAGAAMLELADRFTELLAEAQNESTPDVTITSRDVSAWNAHLRAAGLPADVTSLAPTLGITAAQLSAMRDDDLAVDPDDLTGTLEEKVTALRDALVDLGGLWILLPAADLAHL